MVFLAETSASNVSSVSLNGYFTSDYDVYKIFIDGVYGANNDAYIEITFNTTGSYTEQTSSYYSLMGSYRYEGDGSTGGAFVGYGNVSNMRFAYTQNTTGGSSSADLTLYNPMSSTYKKIITGSVGMTHTQYVGLGGFTGYWNNTTAVTGIRFKSSTGNLYARKIRLYGIKNS